MKKIALLCEDNQHAAFVRRFLPKHELYRVLREGGEGAGEQFVRKEYSTRLDAARKTNSALIVVIDGDKKTVEERLRQLDEECDREGIARRTDADRVAVFVPMRNIETWLYFLNGEVDGFEKVDESKRYAKLSRERECKPMVKKLREMCRRGNLPDEAPSSLRAACEEYNQRRNILLGES